MLGDMFLGIDHRELWVNGHLRTLSSHSFDFHMKEEVLEHWKANEVLKGGGHDGYMVSKTLAR